MLQNAFLATLIVSTIPNILLVIIPSRLLVAKFKTVDIQNIFLCFAAGGLLGDVFLHIIPHLLLEHDHHDHSAAPHMKQNHAGHSHHHTHDEHLRRLHDDHHHSHHGIHGHDQTSSIPYSSHLSPESVSFVSANEHHTYHTHNDVDGGFHDHSRASFIGIMIMAGFLTFMLAEKFASIRMQRRKEKVDCDHSQLGQSTNVAKDTHQHQHNHLPSYSKLTSAAILNLFADSMHNFTDGIAIGASFAAGAGSSSFALATVFSVIFHEIPHEIGDFTILVQSGFSKWEAIRAQFVTAVAAFIGTYFGYAGHRSELLNNILLSVTAGGFLYIATVSVLPTVMRTRDEDDGGPLGYWQMLLEALAFTLGISFMVAVAALE